MRTRWALLAVVLLVALVGCGGPDDEADANGGGEPTAAAAERTSLGSEAEDTVAVEAADRVVALWARPGADPVAWTSELRPHLSVVAMSTLSYVDQESLPAASPSGDSFVTAGDELTAVVVVPTDAGDFRVSLSRRSADANWSADQVSSPSD